VGVTGTRSALLLLDLAALFLDTDIRIAVHVFVAGLVYVTLAGPAYSTHAHRIFTVVVFVAQPLVGNLPGIRTHLSQAPAFTELGTATLEAPGVVVEAIHGALLKEAPLVRCLELPETILVDTIASLLVAVVLALGLASLQGVDVGELSLPWNGQGQQ